MFPLGNPSQLYSEAAGVSEMSSKAPQYKGINNNPNIMQKHGSMWPDFLSLRRDRVDEL